MTVDRRSKRAAPGKCYQKLSVAEPSHIHASLRDAKGTNVFAVTTHDLATGGRSDASHDQLKFISREAEYFLAGLVTGLADGQSPSAHDLASVLMLTDQ
jgi:hypothetical protein